ncbi:ACP S-malonyltransferase [uncultured Aquimarina sp.]|uniref:ACP S-malonyltransferase n=1 Tax=uncultured Aquimarina sp. TaxID=575652 RepID=UPI002603F6AD|nr:ACP S-malonyltransferase [uncultured Aquimarina sp.]
MKTVMFPGQGSQYKGMGKDLFPMYRSQTELASSILGYDLEELCLSDPKRLLGKTQFTQPALYVVNAFRYYEQYKNEIPDYLIGHSLGEYNALLSAGVFDFETGLRMVQKRGELMAAASGGGMIAVLGLDSKELRQQLDDSDYDEVDIANFNSPSQIVISGKSEVMESVLKNFDGKGIKAIPLFVSAPFHSRYMKPAADEFKEFIKGFEFSPTKVPVIANATALPYNPNDIKNLLSTQITSSVQWIDSIRFLMGKGVSQYEEIGGSILTKMVGEITEKCSPIKEIANIKTSSTPINSEKSTTDNDNLLQINNDKVAAIQLGSKAFRDDHNVKYAYMTGSMYRGIASKELVVKMANSNMLSFLGTGGMSIQEIEENIKYIQSNVDKTASYGMNLLHDMACPSNEMDQVTLFLKYKIRKVEASAFMQITKSLVYYHLAGLERNSEGIIECKNKIIAKVSRPEVAEVFMKPAPRKFVNQLLDENLISQEQAVMSESVPMCYDICVEADSGGHTDGGVAFVLFPSIKQLKNQIESSYNYNKSIRIGLGGGIGTPSAVACAYIMGADFITTGSINQCTVEAGTSNTVKDLLQDINVQDTDYAPAGDMFEIGSRIQVLKKGVLFPARANKLFAIYRQYDSLDDIPQKIQTRLEKSYFKKSISEVWEETKAYLINNNERDEVAKAEQIPSHKMALVFKWYFAYSNRLAFEGNIENKSDFQVHTGPALGSFNQWVKGTSLEHWKNRHVDEIGIKIMEEGADILSEKLLNMIK